ncbi:MAG: deoxynucleoside kinase [Clostridia bacterium]|nr:deoxynucleoside kinase [Clostridia bacterium]
MGFLITIEAPDASGKATQTELLRKHLETDGYTTYKFSFPNYGSDACKPVELYLSGTLGEKATDTGAYAASVFFAVDRFFSYKTEWEKLLGDDKTVVVLDRYTTSNAVHQICKLPKAEWDDYLSWLYDFEFNKMSLPVPDITVSLDVKPDVSKKLLEKRAKEDAFHKSDIHEADSEYLEKCYDAAKYAAEKWGWTRIDCCDGDQMKSREEIHSMIYKAVTDKMKGNE